ncbi:hypothetical protein HRR85_006277 [Exophiala dermatitidis]|nr:hypothetical protein HRR85_006277 [Exophiala dermatitidis]
MYLQAAAAASTTSYNTIPQLYSTRYFNGCTTLSSDKDSSRHFLSHSNHSSTLRSPNDIHDIFSLSRPRPSNASFLQGKESSRNASRHSFHTAHQYHPFKTHI